MKLAVAEVDVRGVTAREVAAIAEKLRGLGVTGAGVGTAGRRSILGAGASLSEAGPHRRDFLASPRARGLQGRSRSRPTTMAG